MKRKRKSYKNNYYNITINNNYYNNVEKDPQETEDTNNKEIDNNNQNRLFIRMCGIENRLKAA